jgi:hypothetical protein
MAGGFQAAFLLFNDQAQLAELAGDVQQIADEPAHWPGKFLDKRRGRDNLMRARQVRLLIDVNHFERAIVFQFRFTQFTDVQDSLARASRGSRHEKSQNVFAPEPGGRGLFKGFGRPADFFCFQDVRFG